MYEQFYKFSAEPFRLSPDHAFAYSHKGYTKARAYMNYAFLRAEGFVMITGRPGTGKTTLIGALVDELANKNVNIANLVCTQVQADDLLKLVAYDFGIPTSVVEKGELLQRLTQRFKSWHRDGHRALLIVDEAQDLSVSAMEELRLLTNIQIDSRPLLQIFLLGQPELRELILSPAMEQVHQRIIAACHLQPLECDETEDYIRHRLSAVRWQGNPAISKAVYPLIYKFSEGVPRRINLICSRLLLHSAVEQRHQVTVADMRDVVGELQNENLASGNSFLESDFHAVDIFDDIQVNSVPVAARPAHSAAAPTQSAAAKATQSLADRDQRMGNDNGNGTAPANGSVNNSQTGILSPQVENSRYQQKEDIPALKMVVGGGRTAPAAMPAPKPVQAHIEPRKETASKLVVNVASARAQESRAQQGSTQKSIAPISRTARPIPAKQRPLARSRGDSHECGTAIASRTGGTEKEFPKPGPKLKQSDRSSPPSASADTADTKPASKVMVTHKRPGGNMQANWPLAVIFFISILLVTWAVISFEV